VKKITKYIFLLFLTCFSFFYTDKVINLINQKDPLMSELIKMKPTYDILPVNSVIENDTIIPGIKGRELNIEKSYNNMKTGGIFREDILVFNYILPSVSLKENKDKYIIKGNNQKKEVAILTILNKNNIDKIKEIDTITIFINHKDLTIDTINKLQNKEIYSYGNNGIYTKETITNDNHIINTLSNNKSKYCFTKEKNKNTLNVCHENNMNTIIPTIIGDYYKIKNNLSNGSIILLNNLNDIDIIMRYIKSKGYNIVTLEKLLSE